ncbi:hypothetical protein TBK1r_78860 [Stieleria magnilauensis]|uniref:Uncharacterized protein n=1 Tax=Stieleria magnilauensis TaxID=2527963 RepID=A0ABX5Y5Q7_9BACT|nr:hypothetical protein TBK1r_78860 [Planctomycetes bacterium TBK1r]
MLHSVAFRAAGAGCSVGGRRPGWQAEPAGWADTIVIVGGPKEGPSAR